MISGGLCRLSVQNSLALSGSAAVLCSKVPYLAPALPNGSAHDNPAPATYFGKMHSGDQKRSC